ncbi:MAG: UDP-N-acetylglucosamine 2-epimerase (non-hydrolyzing) [Chthoniobacterales bacterium]|nr:UDP-N-acetylglucosamine 2-epimerase (non-hydrolyzing) [Chthoniobacterales bacterium]
MNKRLKVLTVVGTRPEIIRLSRVLAALDRHTEHTLVHTGQNYDYELNQIFFDELGIRPPDIFLNAVGSTVAETIGNIIAHSDRVLAEKNPDAVLVLGDTNSCLSVISAKRRKIPIFHMEAGNRCFDARVPEEINRRIVDHTADINLPYSGIAREYLLREGIAPDRIIKTGSPMFEVLNFYRQKIEASDAVARLDLSDHQFFVVSCHREENVDSPVHLRRFVHMINALVERFALPVIVSTHPRTRKNIDAAKLPLQPLVNLLKPLGFPDYVRLQQSARAVLSDSGTISEESSILNFPAVNIREAHERPEAMEEASVMMTGLDTERVLQALEILESQPRGSERLLRMVGDYAVPNVSEKVVRVILSHTDFVNRVVWNKSSGGGHD